MSRTPGQGHHTDGPMQDDLRSEIAAAIQEQSSVLVGDAVAVFPFSSAEMLEPDYCNRIATVVVEMLVGAIRTGNVDARGGSVADLQRVALERNLAAPALFTLVYLLERSALDELALNGSIGATSEAWPLVAQIVRRASFDLLAAYTELAQFEPGEASIVDKLTTLHTRPLFDAVLAKELERAGRLGYPLSIILFDVDRLASINREHGYGVGDRILERLGILIRQYFRHHDWVARHSGDSVVVLLAHTDGNHATNLAERVRSTVEDRLESIDHRNDRPVHVTLSAAVVNLDIEAGNIIDPDRLMADAERTVARAKQEGRNRVVRVDGYSGAPQTPARSA